MASKKEARLGIEMVGKTLLAKGYGCYVSTLECAFFIYKVRRLRVNIV